MAINLRAAPFWIIVAMSTGLTAAAVGCKEESRAKIEKLPARTADLGSKPAPRTRPSANDEEPFHLLKFELEDSGRGPKSLLRYQIKSAVATHVKNEAVLKLTDMDKPATIETGLAITASVPKPGKPVQLTVVGLPGHGPDELLAGYREAITSTRVSADIDDRGQLLRIGGTASIGKKREMAAFLLRALVPLPAEEVGLGARWKIKYAIGRGGVYIAQTTIYELTKVDGKTLSVNVVTTDSAEPQPMVLDGQVVGSLVALKSESKGSAIVNLEKPTMSGQDEGTLTMHATVEGNKEFFRESTRSAKLTSTQVESP